MIKVEDFWYIVALEKHLNSTTVLSRTVLGEWLVIFRGENGQPVALRDRCQHRHSRLSTGKVCCGKLQCPYHGWVYDQTGAVIMVPAMGEQFQSRSSQQAKCYQTREQDGYIYVRLADQPTETFEPFAMPNYGCLGWDTVRVINRFRNTMTNCVENFIDIPHTAFVHSGIFRSTQRKMLEMTVARQAGSVVAEYHHETNNLGWFAQFLNQQGLEIEHVDRFQMPNVTCVSYNMGKKRQLLITSQSIPETEDSTLVYTDITFNYGLWNLLARPLIYWTAQKIIRQDIEILDRQGETISKYGTQFANTSTDTIHLFVESIQNAIAAGEDPRKLPDKRIKVAFWI